MRKKGGVVGGAGAKGREGAVKIPWQIMAIAEIWLSHQVSLRNAIGRCYCRRGTLTSGKAILKLKQYLINHLERQVYSTNWILCAPRLQGHNTY